MYFESYAESVFDFDLDREDSDHRNWRNIADLSCLPALVDSDDLAAESEIDKLLTKYQDFGFVHAWHAALWRNRSRPDLARAAYLDGIALSRERTILCCNLGDLEREAGSLTEAVRWWARSVGIQIRDGQVIHANPFVLLGCLSLMLDVEYSGFRLRFAGMEGVHGPLSASDGASESLRSLLVDTNNRKASKMVIERLTDPCRWLGPVAEKAEQGLHLMVRIGHPEDLLKLIEAGYQLNGGASLHDRSGVTPLMEAAWECRLDMAAELLRLGADVNATDNGGSTAMHIATYRGDLEMIELLHRNGAGLRITNRAGLSAYDTAIRCGDERVVRLFQWVEFHGTAEGFPQW